MLGETSTTAHINAVTHAPKAKKMTTSPKTSKGRDLNSRYEACEGRDAAVVSSEVLVSASSFLVFGQFLSFSV